MGRRTLARLAREKSAHERAVDQFHPGGATSPGPEPLPLTVESAKAELLEQAIQYGLRGDYSSHRMRDLALFITAREAK